MTSTRILKPSGDSRGASRETISRRIMKKPLIGSVTSRPAMRRKNQAPRSLSFWRAGERPPGAARRHARADGEIAAARASASYIFGRIDSSCCRSPSITATRSALETASPRSPRRRGRGD